MILTVFLPHRLRGQPNSPAKGRKDQGWQPTATATEAMVTRASPSATTAAPATVASAAAKAVTAIKKAVTTMTATRMSATAAANPVVGEAPVTAPAAAAQPIVQIIHEREGIKDEKGAARRATWDAQPTQKNENGIETDPAGEKKIEKSHEKGSILDEVSHPQNRTENFAHEVVLLKTSSDKVLQTGGLKGNLSLSLSLNDTAQAYSSIGQKGKDRAGQKEKEDTHTKDVTLAIQERTPLRAPTKI